MYVTDGICLACVQSIEMEDGDERKEGDHILSPAPYTHITCPGIVRTWKPTYVLPLSPLSLESSKARRITADQ